jgi:perosamine synthetase
MIRVNNPKDGYDATRVGYKYHMNDIAASMGLGNLEVIDKRLARVKDIANIYFNELKNCPVELMRYNKDRTSSYWLFPVLVQNRADFIRKMKDNNIPVSVVHLGIDKNSIFGGKKMDLVNQRYWDEHQIHLPINDELTDEDVSKVIETIKSGW